MSSLDFVIAFGIFCSSGFVYLGVYFLLLLSFYCLPFTPVNVVLQPAVTLSLSDNASVTETGWTLDLFQMWKSPHVMICNCSPTSAKDVIRQRTFAAPWFSGFTFKYHVV